MTLEPPATSAPSPTAPPATDVDPLYAEAIARLRTLMDDACRRGDRECYAAALATADRQARPSVRMISVARIGDAGIVLFAHTETGKGQQLQQNPRAALCFHWPLLQYQAIVEGAVVLLPESDADALWRAQPREFGIGHWASEQTGADDKAQRQAGVREYRQRFESERVPRAPRWRAFEIRPDRIDFWPSGWVRLSARVRYLKGGDGRWQVSRENP